MTIHWDGEREDAEAAIRAAEQRRQFLANATSEPIVLANEFSEIRVVRVETRNGSRLLIDSTKSGQWVALCPLELESITWQNTATFSAMIGHPNAPLIEGGE